MSKSEKGKNQCIRELVYQDIRELGYQYIYPHCFASRNKAWGREKNIENKPNFKLVKIDISSSLTSKYEGF